MAEVVENKAKHNCFDLEELLVDLEEAMGQGTNAKK